MILKMKKLMMVLMAIVLPFLLSACEKSDFVLLDPKGPVSQGQVNMIYYSTFLILLVVIPVIILLVRITIRYRESNTKVKYMPEWAHNTKLEVVWWSIPIIIIIFLATATFNSSIALDPKKSVAKPGEKELKIQAISLNWKWLFLYPEQKIATVDYLQLPLDVPVMIQLTADAPMNSLLIPNLAGQVYAMAGMTTHLNMRGEHIGEYQGISASFTGGEYAKMRFVTKVDTVQKFDEWVNQVKASNNPLSLDVYQELVKDSLVKPTRYSVFSEGLYQFVLDKYTKPIKGVNISDDGRTAYDPNPKVKVDHNKLKDTSKETQGHGQGHSGH